MSLLQELSNDAKGLMLLKDWLGDGGHPVDRVVAEQRAAICTGGNAGTHCINNVEPNWWNRVKHAVAEVICDQLSLKHKFSIETSKDVSLHMCKVCGCCLKLKVHTPPEHIAKHTTAPMLEQFPDFCWIKRETQKI